MNVKITRDGLILRGILKKASDKKCPIAIMFHGFGGNIDDKEGSVFQTISTMLKEINISTIRFDFNGHGKSDGNFSDMNIFNEIEDAIAILSYVRTLDFVSDIYLIGHSQGGVIAGMLAGYYNDIIEKLILLAPAASLKTDAQVGKCMLATYDTNHIPDYVDVDNGNHIVGGHYFRIAKTLPIYEVTKQFQNPTLIIHGKNDEIINLDDVKKYKEELVNCKLNLYDDLNHGLYGKDQQKMYDDINHFLLSI